MFQLFACATFNLLQKFSKLRGHVCGVAMEDKSIVSMDLTRVMNDDNLLCKKKSKFDTENRHSLKLSIGEPPRKCSRFRCLYYLTQHVYVVQ